MKKPFVLLGMGLALLCMAAATTVWYSSSTAISPLNDDLILAVEQTTPHTYKKTTIGAIKDYARAGLQYGNASLTNISGQEVLTNGHSAAVTFSNNVTVVGTLTVNSTNQTTTVEDLVVNGSMSGTVGASNIVGTVADATSAVNSTNLFNANLPVPTNAPSSGQVPTATSTTTAAWQTPSSSVNSQIITANLSSAPLTTSDKFYNINGGASSATEAQVSTMFLRPATLTNLWVKFPSPPSAGTNVTLTVYTNGVASDLVATVDPSKTAGTNITSSVSVSRFSTVSFNFKSNGTITVAPATWLLEIVY